MWQSRVSYERRWPREFRDFDPGRQGGEPVGWLSNFVTPQEATPGMLLP